MSGPYPKQIVKFNLKEGGVFSDASSESQSLNSCGFNKTHSSYMTAFLGIIKNCFIRGLASCLPPTEIKEWSLAHSQLDCHRTVSAWESELAAGV